MRAHRLYFVRHGETDWNAARRLQGLHDIPLYAVGRRQAARCGELLGRLFAQSGAEPHEFTFATSPLSRARETMEILRLALGLPQEGYAIDARLAELSFGSWEGLTYREVRDRDRAILGKRDRDKWNFQPPGGESYAQLLVRVREWHESLSGDAVVTAHGGVARAFLVLFGIKSTAEAPLGDIAQGVIYEFMPGSVNRYG
ncbi:MAG: histidine phosphatase family protein [Xanthobacteraceae bacterium]|nr:histidine phosphatase family protein [Xanthobacteraceae bacterium]